MDELKNIPAWFFVPFKRMIDFNGRSRRIEFWTFAIINTLILSVLYYAGESISQFDVAAKLYTLIVILPGISVGMRRLHDIGKSGWWLLLLFIILIGLPILIYFFIQDSQHGENVYGENPKE